MQPVISPLGIVQYKPTFEHVHPPVSIFDGGPGVLRGSFVNLSGLLWKPSFKSYPISVKLIN